MSIPEMRTACRIGAWSVVLAVCVAATEPVSAAQPRVSDADRDVGRPPLKNNRYTFLYLGGFATGETATVLDRSTGDSAFGAGWGWRFHRLLTFELDMNISSTDYELPGSMNRSHLGDLKLTLSTVGLLGNLKLGRQLGRLRPQIGVGLGAGLVDVALSDSEYWFPETLESQLSVLTQVLAGIDIRVSSRSYLGIEYRKLFAHRKIFFDGEEVDGGGESFVLAYRLAW